MNTQIHAPGHVIHLFVRRGPISAVPLRYPLDTLKEAIRREPDNDMGRVRLISALSECGRLDEAKSAASELLRLYPEYSATRALWPFFYRDPELRQRLLDQLRKAGLPE